MSVTHVAGPLVFLRVQDRAVQRCALCGEKLSDVRPSCVMVPEGSDGRIPQFAEAHLIQVEGEFPKSFHDLGDFREVDLPDDFCLALVEQ